MLIVRNLVLDHSICVLAEILKTTATSKLINGRSVRVTHSMLRLLREVTQLAREAAHWSTAHPGHR